MLKSRLIGSNFAPLPVFMATSLWANSTIRCSLVLKTAHYRTKMSNPTMPPKLPQAIAHPIL